MSQDDSTPPPPLTRTQWLIVGVAAIGFAFDIYELLMLPLIAREAMMDLGGLRPGTPQFANWLSLLFYVPAVCGGVFGLLGGYLTDRFGRRRVLVWSILLYAFSAMGAGFATSLPMLLFLRCTTFVGVCVEFVAAVAWLAETFPHPVQREKILGWTQAFSSLGGFMVATVNHAIAAPDTLAALPAIHGDQAAWRYTLISGVVPAIPLIVVRPFLPESPAWAEKRAAGTLRRPSIGELFQPALLRTTVVTTIMVACAYAVAFGAIQQIPQIVPGFSEVARLPRPAQQGPIAATQQLQEIGGLLGRCALAVLAVIVVSRRSLVRLFLVPGLIAIPAVFVLLGRTDLEAFRWGVFVAGFLTVAQFSFWGNYLPRVYPTHLRGTGESFAANIGGRLIGTSAAAVTAQLHTLMPGANPAHKFAVAAAVVAVTVQAIGFMASFWLPEPKAQAPDE